MLTILADENIPLLAELFGHAGKLITKPGRTIQRTDCEQADILLVRSVTAVNAALLKDTPIRFVGSATTGEDHLDTAWLTANHTPWATATGCNTMAVANYVICLVAALQKMGHLDAQHRKAAIIGAGRIGTTVAAHLQYCGFDTILCDPFRSDLPTVALEAIANVDLISLHTPLTHTGPHPTWHLIDRAFLARQKPGCILVNTGRGAAIATDDLLQTGNTPYACLDVFENEPFPSPALLEQALLTTPHIAGYSVQAKWRGTQMLYEATVQAGLLQALPTAFPSLPRQALSLSGIKADWQEVVLRVFDPRTCCHAMRDTLKASPEAFDRLRKHFPERHEFGFVDIQDVSLSMKDRHVLEHLSFPSLSHI